MESINRIRTQPTKCKKREEQRQIETEIERASVCVFIRMNKVLDDDDDVVDNDQTFSNSTSHSVAQWQIPIFDIIILFPVSLCICNE